MTDEPDNLVLAKLRELRQEFMGAMQAVVTAMRATEHVYTRFEQFSEELVRLRTEMSEFRSDVRKNFVRFEGDLIHLESQNFWRHGESLNAFRQITKLQRRTVEIEERLAERG